MTPVASRRAPVTVRIDGAAVVFELSDVLDSATGSTLVAAAESAVIAEPDRVDIDLQQLSDWTEGGVTSLVRCREIRSEEHTSELQSLMRISYAVFCLKKKKTTKTIHKVYNR